MLISHNAPYLPPKFCISIVFNFFLGRLYYPGEMKNQGYAKVWGANKVHYGRYASGVWRIEGHVTHTKASGT